MPKKLKWKTHADLGINRNPSIDRDEYLAHMTFKRNDRPLFTELFGPIIGLKEEWEAQGASPHELDFSAFRYRCHKEMHIGVNTARIVTEPPVVIEETEDHILTRDDLGRTCELAKGAASIPLPLDYPVATMDDWLKIKPRYEFNESRLPAGWDAIARKAIADGYAITVGIPGGFDAPRQLMGDANLCLGYYEQPELVHDIVQTISDTVFEVLNRASSTIRIDIVSVHEDMAGNNGPLIGPDTFREFVSPYYRRIWDLMSERGASLFDQDSDGDMNVLMPVLIETGLNVMHPMEPAANMDIVESREKYGAKMAFRGGIDKFIIRKGREAITRELERKLPPMIKSGGCVFSLDHRIPDGSPLENYRFYVSEVWRIFSDLGVA